MPAKSSSGSKENLFSSQLTAIQTRSWQISEQGLLRGTGKGNSVALVHAGISPDYNHLFLFVQYSACMSNLKTLYKKTEAGAIVVLAQTQ